MRAHQRKNWAAGLKGTSMHVNMNLNLSSQFFLPLVLSGSVMPQILQPIFIWIKTGLSFRLRSTEESGTQVLRFCKYIALRSVHPTPNIFSWHKNDLLEIIPPKMKEWHSELYKFSEYDFIWSQIKRSSLTKAYNSILICQVVPWFLIISKLWNVI